MGKDRTSSVVRTTAAAERRVVPRCLSSVHRADAAEHDGTPTGACSYFGPRNAPRRTDHDTFEIQTVHVQPRIDRHAPTRPSLVRVSQVPVVSESFRKRCMWPYVVVPAVVSALLLCWLAWPARSAVVTDVSFSETRTGPLSAATPSNHAVFSRESRGVTEPDPAVDRRVPVTKKLARDPVPVKRPAAPASRSRQARPMGRSGTRSPQEQSRTAPPRAESAGTPAGQLLRLPWAD